ncbi:hypothetical protein ANRL3_00280 [Anaerolineae bacterium]|nr:hypothetical protein ANRL3_00280 [Anaerolineae bacterium]
MCNCKTLPSRWWVRDDESDRESSSRGWKQEDRVGAGWAVLWKCPACGQYWEGIVSCSNNLQDCIAKYDGREEDWFNQNVQKYEQYTQENRCLQKIEELYKEYQGNGYEVKSSPYHDPVLGFVPWMYHFACRKQGRVRSFILTLANNGSVCVREEKD